MGQCRSSISTINDAEVSVVPVNQKPLMIVCTESSSGEDPQLIINKGKEPKPVAYKEHTIPASPGSSFSSKSLHSPVSFRLCPRTGMILLGADNSEEHSYFEESDISQYLFESRDDDNDKRICNRTYLRS